MKKNSRIYAKIDLDAVAHNFEEMHRNISENTKMIAVVKADGYGHGAVPIAKMAESYEYIWGFAAATAEEAYALRQAGIKKPILILGFVFEENYEELVKQEIRPAVFKVSMARQLSETAVSMGKSIPIHLAVDTGMSRIGFADNEESLEWIQEIEKMPGICIEGIFTHFSKADELDKTSVNLQFQRFTEFVKKLEVCGVSIPIRHCSNSAALIEMPQANMDIVRAGISIYGIYPSGEVEKSVVHLQPVMELKSHISFLKEVEEGTEVSYGGTFVTKRKTKIATIPAGYADGYPRLLSNKGYVLIRGQKAPIIGRICMDQFMVDVTDVCDVAEEDTVTLMGRDGEEMLPVEVLSELSGRFPYEFVCDISKRVPRVYVQNGKITAPNDGIDIY